MHLLISEIKRGKIPIQSFQPYLPLGRQNYPQKHGSDHVTSLLNRCSWLSITLKQGPHCLAYLSSFISLLLGTTHFPAEPNSTSSSCFSHHPRATYNVLQRKIMRSAFGSWQPQGDIPPQCSPNQNLWHQSGEMSAVFVFLMKTVLPQ